MLVGVTSGFTSNINLIGVGYKGHFIPASSKWPYGQLSLSLGFGHSVIVPLSSNLHIDPLKIVNSSQGAVIPVSSNVYGFFALQPPTETDCSSASAEYDAIGNFAVAVPQEQANAWV